MLKMAPPFSAPVDQNLFPDYTSRIPNPMDLRTAAERLAKGMYKFGPAGEAAEAAASSLPADSEAAKAAVFLAGLQAADVTEAAA